MSSLMLDQIFLLFLASSCQKKPFAGQKKARYIPGRATLQFSALLAKFNEKKKRFHSQTFLFTVPISFPPNSHSSIDRGIPLSV